MMKTLRELIEKASGLDEAQLSRPEFAELGHFTTNAAFAMAKRDECKPIEAAAALKSAVMLASPDGLIDRIDIAAPGFVNFWISKGAIQKELGIIVDQEKYGSGTSRKGKRILVEFTDPNPFKEFHIGHLMSNSIGESISRLFEEQGADVVRLSYGGDIGLHVAKAIFGILAKKDKIAGAKKKDEKEQLKFWANAYVSGSTSYEEDEASKKEIDRLNKVILDKSDKEIGELYDWGRELSIKAFTELFARLDTKFVKNYWESEVVESAMKAVEAGLSKKILEKSEGAVVFKGEPYGLHTRVFVNSKGVPTYEAKELGLTLKKQAEFKFDESVVITANEQNDYFKVLLKAVELLMPEIAGKTVHIGHGMLRFSSGKMSSRRGNVITAESLIDQVKEKIKERLDRSKDMNEGEKDRTSEIIAIGAIRYSILRQSPGQDIIFDFDKSLSLEGESGPYLQYAYVRALNIINKADKIGEVDYKLLDSAEELALILKLIEFPDVTKMCADLLASNRLATYLYELAKVMNRFYDAKNVLKAESGVREARLGLVAVAARTLKSGLGLLEINTVEFM